MKWLFCLLLFSTPALAQIAGAKCDGVTDDTAAINAAYVALTGQKTGEIDWPAGQACLISNTILLQNAQSVRIKGGSVLWKGSASNPVFRYSSDRNVTTQGFYITTASASMNPIGTAFAIQEDNGTGFGISSGNIFIGNVIEGVSQGGLNIGFEQVQGTSGDRNNDEMRFIGNEVRNYTTAGWQIDHAQATDDLLEGNQCYSNGFGQQCVNNMIGAGFTWMGGYMSHDLTADFVTGSNSSHPITISGAASENSNRFVLVPGPVAYPVPVSLLNDRFSTNSLNADGHIVLYNAPGPLTVSGGSYGQGNAPGDFYFNPSQTSYHAIYGEISSVTFSGHASYLTPFLKYANGITGINVKISSNVFRDTAGNAVPYNGVPAGHSVTLWWKPSQVGGSVTYNVYSMNINGTTSIGAGSNPTAAGFTLLASGLSSSTLNYIDTTVTPGQWAYCVTSVVNGQESPASNLVMFEVSSDGSGTPIDLEVSNFQ